MKIAAVQLKAKLGNIDYNMRTAEALAREAFQQGAKLVVLPEFFTSAGGFSRTMLDSALPKDGKATELLKNLAHEYEGVVGGSFISYCDGESRNTFILAFSDGSLFYHEKDQPTMWENCYYVGGSDDGVLDTPFGTIGAAMCWEFVRTRTARRFLGRVCCVVGGSCWHTLPEAWLPWFPKRLIEENLAIMKDTPPRFARLLGVPVVHAAHAGDFLCSMPLMPGFPFKSYYLGETQIVDGDGTVVAAMAREDNEGFVMADISLNKRHEPSEEISNRFWIPNLPPQFRFIWWYQNLHGRIYYRLVTKPYRNRIFALKSPRLHKT